MDLRQRIINQSAKLFFNQGIKSITMSDIAQDVGISKRTLYEIFPNKEELLEATLNYHTYKTDKEMEKFLEGSENAIDTLMRIYAKQLSEMQTTNRSVIYDLKKYYPQIYAKVNTKHKKNVDNFVPLFTKGMEQGLIRKDLNIQILMWMLGAQFKSLMESDWSITTQFSIKEFVSEIILTFTRGIATPKGIEVIDEAIVRIEEEIKQRNQTNNTIN